MEPDLDSASASELPLCDGETLNHRRAREDFVAWGLRPCGDARRTGLHHRAETSHDELQQRLSARQKIALG